MFPKMNPAFAAFVAPAKAHPQTWRAVGGLVVAALIYLGVVIAILRLAGDFLSSEIGNSGAKGNQTYGSPGSTAIIFLTFTGMALGIFVAAQLFQNRGPRTLLGPNLRMVRKHFIVSFTVVFAILVPATAISIFVYTPLSNLPFLTWLGWLPLALILVFVQTTSEELVFRGYIQQQLAARFSSPVIWWVLPSALFGMAHFDPSTFGSNTWLVVFDTFLVGLIAADLTCRTGNLGAAMGLHFANNIFAVLFISLNGDISGLALHVTPYSNADTDVLRNLLFVDIGFLAIAYLIYLRIMVRRGY